MAPPPTRFIDSDEPTQPRPPLTPYSRPDTPEPPPLLTATPPTLSGRAVSYRPHPLAPEIVPTPLWKRPRVWLGFGAGAGFGFLVTIAVFVAAVLLAPTPEADPRAALGAAWDHVASAFDDAPPAGIEPTADPSGAP